MQFEILDLDPLENLLNQFQSHLYFLNISPFLLKSKAIK